MTAPHAPSAWFAFAPYAVVSVIHVVALAMASDAVAGPTKLLLMPLLAAGAVWMLRGGARRTPALLLLAALALSWLGDGAATFFAGLPTLPLMLACFGLAHVAYMALFARYSAIRRVRAWSVVYIVWWIGMIAVLWPHLGALAVAVAAYGLVLGSTATLATRGGPVVAAGGALFLASDTILAGRLFLPDVMPDWTSPAVMLTYCLGQGLIVAGVVAILLRARARRDAERSVHA